MLNLNDFKQSIRSIDILGATPTVLVKVMEHAKDPNGDLGTIGALLRNDGLLAADIIRISNSPYYAPASLHSNLASAINFIGAQEVVRVVSLSLAKQVFARDLVNYRISAADYWSESVTAALLMEQLAGCAGMDQEDAFTVGTLHAIGRIFINRVIDEKRLNRVWDRQQTIDEWERSVVGFDFAEAGAMLLERWCFPRPMCQTIRWQLRDPKTTQPSPMLLMLRCARRLLTLTGPRFENQSYHVSEADPFMTAFELTPELADRLIIQCRQNFQKVRQSVDLA